MSSAYLGTNTVENTVYINLDQVPFWLDPSNNRTYDVQGINTFHF